MKKILSIFSLLLIITGCSCNKESIDGVYTFQYLEYKRDGQTLRTDCENLEELDIKIQTACASKVLTITLEGNKIIYAMNPDYPQPGYFKIVGNQIHMNETEEGEYYYSGWIHYIDGKRYYGINDTYIVLDN